MALWDAARVAREICEGSVFRAHGAAARDELAEIGDIEAKVAGALLNPKPLDICMPVFNAVLAAQYYEVLKTLAPPKTLSVYEPCVGASCPVILAVEAYSEGQGSYFSLNLNRKLREELRPKIAHLRMNARIVEEHAEVAMAVLAPRTFDVACFHHAVNDILQTAVSEPRGMDTTTVDWFPNERQMIEWLAEDAQSGRLEERGKPELMRIIRDAAHLVTPGGYLVFDHFNWCRFIGVDWFPWDLFYNLIPMTRQWIRESALPVSEVALEGMDPQWWMVLQVGDGGY